MRADRYTQRATVPLEERADLEMGFPVFTVLDYYYKNSSLLFLGCTLNKAPTMQVFRAIKETIRKNLGDIVIPQHFAIEATPETEQEFSDRNAYLPGLGITGIWFQKGQFECIKGMLRCSHNELRYRGIFPVTTKNMSGQATDPKPEKRS